MRDNSFLTTKEDMVRPWLVSPKWDIFWIFNFFWLFLLLISGGYLFDFSKDSAYYLILFAVIIDYCHLFGPFGIILSVPKIRNSFFLDKTKLFQAFLIFLIPTLLIFLYLITPNDVSSSYEEIKSFLLLLSTGIYIFAHHWHHSRQHYGILSLYRRRSQQNEEDSLTRDKFFCYLFACFLAPLALFANSYRYKRFFSYFPDVTGYSHVLVWATILLSLTVTIIVILLELKNSRRSIPKVFYYLMMLGQIIVISLSPDFFYLALWLISHGIISIGFTLRMHKNYALKNSSSLSSVPTKWRARLIHGGVFTFLGGLLVYQYAELVPFFFGVLRGREGQHWPPANNDFFDIIYLSLTSGGVLGLFYLHYAAERFLFLRRKRRSQEAFKLLNFKF